MIIIKEAFILAGSFIFDVLPKLLLKEILQTPDDLLGLALGEDDDRLLPLHLPEQLLQMRDGQSQEKSVSASLPILADQGHIMVARILSQGKKTSPKCNLTLVPFMGESDH